MSKLPWLMAVFFLWGAMACAAEESASPVVKPYSWAVGYDEGLSGPNQSAKGT